MDINERNVRLITLGAMVQQAINMDAIYGDPSFRIQLFGGDPLRKVVVRRLIGDDERVADFRQAKAIKDPITRREYLEEAVQIDTFAVRNMGKPWIVQLGYSPLTNVLCIYPPDWWLAEVENDDTGPCEHEYIRALRPTKTGDKVDSFCVKCKQWRTYMDKSPSQLAQTAYREGAVDDIS